MPSKHCITARRLKYSVINNIKTKLGLSSEHIAHITNISPFRIIQKSESIPVSIKQYDIALRVNDFAKEWDKQYKERMSSLINISDIYLLLSKENINNLAKEDIIKKAKELCNAKCY